MAADAVRPVCLDHSVNVHKICSAESPDTRCCASSLILTPSFKMLCMLGVRKDQSLSYITER